MEIIIWIKAPEPGRSAKEESMQSLADFPDRHSQDWQFMYPEGEGPERGGETHGERLCLRLLLGLKSNMKEL